MSDDPQTPPPTPESPGTIVPGPYSLAFFLFLALWTWKLLQPQPVPEVIRGGLGVDWMFFLAKALHAGGYAFLTVLGATAFPRRARWVVAFLALHGVGTEIGQTFVPNRFGSVRDVLIDWGGIAGGVVARRIWRRSGQGSAQTRHHLRA